MSDSISASEETWAGTLQGAGVSASRGNIDGLVQRGAKLDRYTVLERLGIGASGIVYSAYHPALDRKIAVKVLLGPGVDDESSPRRHRFLREAQALARLSHPNVVTVHDVGVFEGRPFIAMEFVDGVTLGAWLRERQRPVAEVLSVFAAAGRGLAAIHEQGLVHRDFKPDNVMVAAARGSKRDSGWRVRVMDLGVARLLDAEEPAESDAPEQERAQRSASALHMSMTEHGALVGTPAYMAPEQIDGRDVDERSDQFAFCVALWEALYGKRPFGGGSPGEILAAVSEGRIEGPPVRSRADRRLRRILERGLAVDPSTRWPSMDALLHELEHDPSQVRRWAYLGVGGLILIMGALAAQPVLKARAVAECESRSRSIDGLWTDARRRTVRAGFGSTDLPFAEDTFARLEPRVLQHLEQWQKVARDACVAVEVEQDWAPSRYEATLACLAERQQELDELLSLFEDEPGFEEAAEALPTLLRLTPPTDCGKDSVETRHAEGARVAPPAIRARLARASSLLDLGRTSQAEATAREVLEAAKEAGWAWERARAVHLLGRIEAMSIQGSESRNRLREAFVLALAAQDWELAIDAATAIGRSIAMVGESAAESSFWVDLADNLLVNVSEPTMSRARVLSARADVAFFGGRYAEAVELLESALDLIESEVGAEHPYVLPLLERLSQAKVAQGVPAEAVEIAQRHLDLRISMLGPEHPSVDSAYGTLGDAQHQSGDLEAARASFRRAVEIANRSHPPDHPDVVTALSNLGLIENALGNPDEAKTLLEQALRVGEKTHKAEHPRIIALLLNLANVVQSGGDTDRAIDLQRRALALAREVHGDAHPTTGILLANLGITQSLLGDHHSAEASHLEALRITEDAVGPDHNRVAGILINLGFAQHELGKLDESLAAYERALAVAAKVYGPEHYETAYGWHGIAVVALDLGNEQQAIQAARRAVELRERSGLIADQLAESRFVLARALFAAGRRDQSRDEAARALETAELDVTRDNIRSWLESAADR